MSAGWSIERGDGVVFARCDALSIEGLSHAFGSRTQDVGPADSTDPRHQAARADLADAAGCGAGPEYRLRQVHGTHVVRATEIGPGGVEADAAWEHVESLDGCAVGVRTADCVPILLASRDGDLVAAVHAGWRGTAARIAGHTVQALRAQGCEPAELVAAIGPAIGTCCYPVSDSVAAEVASASGTLVEEIADCDGDRTRLNLREANRRQLVDSGVLRGAIAVAPWCTACESSLFFSFRRNATAAGRQFSLIGPTAGRP